MHLQHQQQLKHFSTLFQIFSFISSTSVLDLHNFQLAKCVVLQINSFMTEAVIETIQKPVHWFLLEEQHCFCCQNFPQLPWVVNFLQSSQITLPVSYLYQCVRVTLWYSSKKTHCFDMCLSKQSPSFSSVFAKLSFFLKASFVQPGLILGLCHRLAMWLTELQNSQLNWKDL